MFFELKIFCVRLTGEKGILINRLVMIMFSYAHSIKILTANKLQGYVEGNIDDYSWFAIVNDDKMEFGIDTNTFQKGYGRVTRLCIYKDSYDVEGNPYLPSLSIKRVIYANYQHEWTILNYKYYDIVKELVTYLDMRYSMRLVK